MTALSALHRANVVKGRDGVLVLGAMGSTGGAAADIARAWGCRVITTSRRPGTDVNLTEDPTLEKVKALTGGRGLDVIIDPVGSSELFTAAIQVLGKGGRYCFPSAGKGSEPELKVDARRFYRLNHSLCGINTNLPDEELTPLVREGELPVFCLCHGHC